MVPAQLRNSQLQPRHLAVRPLIIGNLFHTWNTLSACRPIQCNFEIAFNCNDSTATESYSILDCDSLMNCSHRYSQLGQWISWLANQCSTKWTNHYNKRAPVGSLKCRLCWKMYLNLLWSYLCQKAKKIKVTRNDLIQQGEDHVFVPYRNRQHTHNLSSANITFLFDTKLIPCDLDTRRSN